MSYFYLPLCTLMCSLPWPVEWIVFFMSLGERVTVSGRVIRLLIDIHVREYTNCVMVVYY